MLKIKTLAVLSTLILTVHVAAYMPPPSQTHWDGYGSNPYTGGQTQSNQLYQTTGNPNANYNQQFDTNFNNNEFQTSSPQYVTPAPSYQINPPATQAPSQQYYRAQQQYYQQTQVQPFYNSTIPSDTQPIQPQITQPSTTLQPAAGTNSSAPITRPTLTR